MSGLFVYMLLQMTRVIFCNKLKGTTTEGTEALHATQKEWLKQRLPSLKILPQRHRGAARYTKGMTKTEVSKLTIGFCVFVF